MNKVHLLGNYLHYGKNMPRSINKVNIVTCKVCLKQAIKQWVGQPRRRAKERLLFLDPLNNIWYIKE